MSKRGKLLVVSVVVSVLGTLMGPATSSEASVGDDWQRQLMLRAGRLVELGLSLSKDLPPPSEQRQPRQRPVTVAAATTRAAAAAEGISDLGKVSLPVTGDARADMMLSAVRDLLRSREFLAFAGQGGRALRAQGFAAQVAAGDRQSILMLGWWEELQEGIATIVDGAGKVVEGIAKLAGAAAQTVFGAAEIVGGLLVIGSAVVGGVMLAVTGIGTGCTIIVEIPPAWLLCVVGVALITFGGVVWVVTNVGWPLILDGVGNISAGVPAYIDGVATIADGAVTVGQGGLIVQGALVSLVRDLLDAIQGPSIPPTPVVSCEWNGWWYPPAPPDSPYRCTILKDPAAPVPG